MDTDAHEWESDLTEVVIGAGFLEKVYERALIHELALQGVSAKAQVYSLSLTKGSTSASIRPI